MEGDESAGKDKVFCTIRLAFSEFMGSAFSSNSNLGFGQWPARRGVYI